MNKDVGSPNGTETHPKIRFLELKRYKILLVLVTFVAALVFAWINFSSNMDSAASAIESFMDLDLTVLTIGTLWFPAGLIFLWPESLREFFFFTDDPEGLLDLMIYGLLGWVLYAGLSLGMVLVRRQRTALVLYFVLVILLLANIRGCASM